MDAFDFVIIGAGTGGEAAANKARELGATAAIIDREWFGGSCPHIGCLPSKSLLHSAAVHAAGGDEPWAEASARRDYMINRAADAAEPDDSSHVKALERVGAVTYRGEARIVGRGEVEVTHDGTSHGLTARHVIVAVGSVTKVPPIEGLEAVEPWTNREATLTRELPKSLLILGGGPTGTEMAQVFARYGVPTTIVQSGPRILPSDHPRSSATVAQALVEDGVAIRTGVRALRAHAGAGADGAHVVDLDDGSTVEGHRVLVAIGRSYPWDGIGLEHYGLDPSARDGVPRDGRLRIADGLWLVGDVAGPELHTHQAHYQGGLAVRMALGERIEPDYRALPRATYTEPEAASVGFTLDQAREAGIDAFELVADFATSTRGYAVEATSGHVTVVFDRARAIMVGAAIACPDASAAIHECVLAIQARVPVEVLAETIHAFPSTPRIFDGLFADARRELARPGTIVKAAAAG
jgi:pyruvate/2-oxoglutarate dehydrogenase complex dihydrolipoamide dehydrogenase (E3) component